MYYPRGLTQSQRAQRLQPPVPTDHPAPCVPQVLPEMLPAIAMLRNAGLLVGRDGKSHRLLDPANIVVHKYALYRAGPCRTSPGLDLIWPLLDMV